MRLTEYSDKISSPNVLIPSQKSVLKPANYEEIQNWLISKLSKELSLKEEEIDIHEPLASYGLSSMTAVGLTGDLEDLLSIELSATLAWDYPSIEEISIFTFNKVR
jgi:acyl carrier protein